MARVLLRRLRVAEQRVLAAKLKDKTLSARRYQRYRIVGELAGGRSVVTVADRVGCNVMSVYRWRDHFNQRGFTEDGSGALHIIRSHVYRIASDGALEPIDATSGNAAAAGLTRQELLALFASRRTPE